MSWQTLRSISLLCKVLAELWAKYAETWWPREGKYTCSRYNLGRFWLSVRKLTWLIIMKCCIILCLSCILHHVFCILSVTVLNRYNGKAVHFYLCFEEYEGLQRGNKLIKLNINLLATLWVQVVSLHSNRSPWGSENGFSLTDDRGSRMYPNLIMYNTVA